MSNSGWNRPSSTRPPVQKKPSAARGIVAGLVVVILALAGAWYFLGDSLTSTAPKDKKTKTIKEVKPVKISMKTNAVECITKPKKPEEEVLSPSADATSLAAEKKEEATNKVEQVKRKKSPLRSRMERVINMVIPQRAGERLPPVPLDPDASTAEEAMEEIADIERGLANKLEVNEDDTPEEAAWKEAMTAVKEDFRAYMKKGYTFNQYIRALQDKFHADADFYSDAQELVSNSYDDKGLSDDDYRKVKEKVDKLLEERGLPQTEDDETIAQKEAEENAMTEENEKK